MIYVSGIKSKKIPDIWNLCKQYVEMGNNKSKEEMNKSESTPLFPKRLFVPGTVTNHLTSYNHSANGLQVMHSELDWVQRAVALKDHFCHYQNINDRLRHQIDEKSEQMSQNRDLLRRYFLAPFLQF